MAELDAYYEQVTPRLYACDEAKETLRLLFHPPVPQGNRALKVAMPPFNALAFATLPGWARRMYGWPGGPLTDIAATAGLRAARLAFGQQKLFLAAMRAVHRAEWAGEKETALGSFGHHGQVTGQHCLKQPASYWAFTDFTATG